ncbi:MAG: CsgG/HfaB family protein [Candidatus Omnitrophica bacterium]|nr:CsgG/HfaB family protein [Candidatus Omnitrophota bacterium]MBU1048093.1 CsgG/HfaB family protein [Candidatus Omnitrophota bacterium]MBU1631420.1 CsgG/HfaB family protein [Candidatus Omnitrophota bacterium]MBU1766644.1 CsgG/HfaB family protein [Candidatus Omnitrophota bacterium]MBU1889463.1 CsgG/HfaB family protein [Candidatus Omnitrophota bacterium]
MNRKFLSFALLVLVIIIPLEAAETKSQPTIAVLGTTTELSDLCSLVEAGLFQKGLALVERAKIDSILKEQKLTASGLVERDNLLKLGQLIRADGFLLISIEEVPKENKNKLLRIRLIDTAHGLCFLDTFESWDDTKLKETTERITGNVSAMAPKLILPPDKAIPIGIVGIHRVELDERYQWLTRALPVMLSARLNKEPRIIMLEREDLKMLLDEKLLTKGQDTAFLNSAILIDGYLQRGEKEGIKLRDEEDEIKLELHMKDFLGKERAVFTELVHPDEPLTTVEKVVPNIIKELLNASSITVWEPKKEAEEFFLQGDLLKKHGRHKDAISPLETAYALQPDNIIYTGALFENEWGTRVIQGGHTVETGISNYSDLELACTVSRLVRQIKTGYENGSVSADDILKWEELIGKGGAWKGGYLINSASSSTQEVRDINRENRNFFVEILKKISKRNNNRYLPLTAVYISSDNPYELIKNFREFAQEVILPPKIGEMEQSFDERYVACRLILTQLPDRWGPYALSEKSQLREQSKKFQELWIEYVKELTQIKDPLVRFSSCLCLAQILKRGSPEAKEYCLKAVDILLTELNSPNEPFKSNSRTYKESMRSDMKCGIRFAGFPYDEEVSIFEKIYEPLIVNKDCHNLMLWRPTLIGFAPIFRPTPEEERRYIKLLERIADVFETCGTDKWVLTEIKDYLIRAKKKFPELGSSNNPTTLPVNILLSNKDWQQNKKFKHTKFMCQDDMLWISFAEPGVGLAGINLKTRQLTSLWYTDLGGREIAFPCFWEPPLSLVTPINGIAVSANASYVAIWNIGLIEFPGSSVVGKKSFATPKIFTEKDGLPSISITSMAGNGDKLWVAYGGTEQRHGRRAYGTVYSAAEKDSGLGIYNPKTRHWETVFCSTLKSGNNPFNSGNPYVISDLTFSSKKDKLFFVVGNQTRESAQRIDEMNKWWGLWKIDVSTRKPKFLWYREGNDDNSCYSLISGHILDSGDKLWIKGEGSLVEFDPNSEKAKIIINRSWSRNTHPPQPEKEIDYSFSEKKNLFSYGSFDCKCSAVYKDTFWGRLGRNQLITTHKKKEEVQIIDNNILDGDPVQYFFSTPYGLIAIGNGTVGLIETEGIGK